MIPVGFYELCEIRTAHPILTVMFKNILRTFEAEILEIVKNIQPQRKNLGVLIKKSVCPCSKRLAGI